LGFSLNIAPAGHVGSNAMPPSRARRGKPDGSNRGLFRAAAAWGICDPTESVVAAVDHAHKQVLVQAYEFTSAAIAKSVVDAQKRGLDVRVILDKSNLHEDSPRAVK
jgi:hypothetical protein